MKTSVSGESIDQGPTAVGTIAESCPPIGQTQNASPALDIARGVDCGAEFCSGLGTICLPTTTNPPGVIVRKSTVPRGSESDAPGEWNGKAQPITVPSSSTATSVFASFPI